MFVFFPITAVGLMVACASLCLCLYLSDYSWRADGGFVSLCLYRVFFLTVPPLKVVSVR